MVRAIIRDHQNFEPKHPVPANPFYDKWAFVAHAGRGEISLWVCHALKQSCCIAGVYPAPLLPI